MKTLTITILSCLLIMSCSNSPESLFKTGERHFANSEYDMAISSYQQIIDEYPTDSLAQAAIYNITWIELDQKNNFSGGYELLKSIAEKYPESEIGKSASDDIENFPKWLISKSNAARNDSSGNASIDAIEFLSTKFNNHPILPEALYLKGNIYLNDKKDIYRSINTYQEIVHKYKGSSYEPMSQFMIGYIYANVHTDIPKARKAYNTFLQNYPEHELAPSVQFELDYLGKQIDDIDNLSQRKNN